MLSAVLKNAPEIYPLVHSAYSQSTNLFFGNHIIQSSEGVQQGDPLGPLLFCLAIREMTTRLSSSFKVFYLDDGTLCGSVEDVLEDFRFLSEASSDLGLVLNTRKCEVIGNDKNTVSAMLSSLPSLSNVKPAEAILLGSPIGGAPAINSIILSKIQALRSLGERLKLLQAHDALCLLQHALAIPKVLYILRTAPCYQSSLLETFDNVLRSLLEGICNIQLNADSWLQAALPINAGGLGIRSRVMLAPSAFLASATGCASILQTLLPEPISLSMPSIMQDALIVWQNFTTESPPTDDDATKQKFWDSPVVESSFNSLLHRSDAKSTARLLAVNQKESGAWLTAPPLSAVGLRMDNEAIRVAIGLRLGAALCVPHKSNTVESQ